MLLTRIEIGTRLYGASSACTPTLIVVRTSIPGTTLSAYIQFANSSETLIGQSPVIFQIPVSFHNTALVVLVIVEVFRIR